MLGPCGAFGAAVQGIMDDGEDFSILTADLRTYSGIDRFASAHPERVYDVGIAEQNMVGVAAGMAKEGIRVFATTYATFASTRCLDQVRVNMGYMQLPIVLVGLTSGLSVGILGATHMSCEDMAIMRAIPNLVILSPSDCLETVKATEAALKANRPVYLRLPGGTNTPIVNHEDYDFEIGKARWIREGNEVAIIATGAMVASALEAASIIEAQIRVSVGVLNMHTIKPLDMEAVDDIARNGAKLIVTAEEHSVVGGLGSAVLDAMNAKAICESRFLKIGLEDVFPHAASYSELRESCGLTGQKMAYKICAEWKNMGA